MTSVEHLGLVVRLPILELGSSGARLEGNLPLPRREVPQGVRVGDTIEVFVYLDSDDRPAATTTRPKIVLGEVAFLEVVDQTSFGAFVDWGLPKNLLVPKAEQTRDVRVGERHPIALYVDDTGRLAGTMRVAEELDESGDFEIDQWVSGEAWRKEPGLGIFVIVEKKSVGLLPESEPNALGRGDAARLRVVRFHRDGKFELSLRGPAHEHIDADAEKVVEVLSRSPLRVGDHSSPEEIRAAFGLSKKAFKRAVGGLLKRGAARLDADGFVVLTKKP